VRVPMPFPWTDVDFIVHPVIVLELLPHFMLLSLLSDDFWLAQI
jgi:hypothetical protein